MRDKKPNQHSPNKVRSLWSRFPLTNEPLALFFYSTGLLALLVLWIWFYLVLRQDNALSPLHYNVYFGVDTFGTKQQLFRLPLTGFLIWLVNLLLGTWLTHRNRFLNLFLAAFTLILSLMLLVAGWLAIRLMTLS